MEAVALKHCLWRNKPGSLLSSRLPGGTREKILIFQTENIFRHLIIWTHTAVLKSIYQSKGLSEFFYFFIFGPAFPPVKWAGDSAMPHRNVIGEITV